MLTRRARLMAGAAVLAAAVVAGASGSATAAQSSETHGVEVIFEHLTGYQETPLALSTTASGQFRAIINEKTQEITYTLSYAGLVGNVTQSHIHFGAVAQTGGVSVFLCTNLGNGPAGTQVCPAAPATITGTIRPADVIGPTGQGIAAGEFAELVAAIRAGAAYVNVHSTQYPGGEMRSQLQHH